MPPKQNTAMMLDSDPYAWEGAERLGCVYGPWWPSMWPIHWVGPTGVLILIAAPPPVIQVFGSHHFCSVCHVADGDLSYFQPGYVQPEF